MKFLETPLAGAYVIDIDPKEDDRGLFARTFCDQEFSAIELEVRFVQCNTSYNLKKGTVRGLHLQRPPYEEIKLVRCTRGRIFDVIVDLRHDSDSRFRWYGVELTQDNRRSVYIPKGFAHGFQTLADESEVFYQMSQAFVTHAGAGINWQDRCVGITWPLQPAILSEKDASLPSLSDFLIPEKIS